MYDYQIMLLGLLSNVSFLQLLSNYLQFVLFSLESLISFFLFDITVSSFILCQLYLLRFRPWYKYLWNSSNYSNTFYIQELLWVSFFLLCCGLLIILFSSSRCNPLLTLCINDIFFLLSYSHISHLSYIYLHNINCLLLKTL